MKTAYLLKLIRWGYVNQESIKALVARIALLWPEAEGIIADIKKLYASLPSQDTFEAMSVEDQDASILAFIEKETQAAGFFGGGRLKKLFEKAAPFIKDIIIPILLDQLKDQLLPTIKEAQALAAQTNEKIADKTTTDTCDEAVPKPTSHKKR